MNWELWYIDEYFCAACSMDWKVRSTGDHVKTILVKPANKFQLQSGEGEFIDWNIEANNGMVIKRSIQAIKTESNANTKSRTS
jgi:hypothetical protein